MSIAPVFACMTLGAPREAAAFGLKVLTADSPTHGIWWGLVLVSEGGYPSSFFALCGRVFSCPGSYGACASCPKRCLYIGVGDRILSYLDAGLAVTAPELHTGQAACSALQGWLPQWALRSIQQCQDVIIACGPAHTLAPHSHAGTLTAPSAAQWRC